MTYIYEELFRTIFWTILSVYVVWPGVTSCVM